MRSEVSLLESLPTVSAERGSQSYPWESAVSAVCAGSLFATHPALLITFCLIWGFAVVADSAQFSATVTELAEPQLELALAFQ